MKPVQHKVVLDDGVDGINILIEDQSKNMSVELDSASNNMTIKNKAGKVVVDSQGEIHLKSATKVLIEAPDVQIIGSGYVKVQSSGAHDVKGNPVKINC